MVKNAAPLPQPMCTAGGGQRVNNREAKTQIFFILERQSGQIFWDSQKSSQGTHCTKVLINWPKIPQMLQNLSAIIVCLSLKVWDFDEIRLH